MIQSTPPRPRDSRAKDTPEPDTYPRWAALNWFALNRLSLAAGLILVYLSPFADTWNSTAPSPLIVTVSLAYLPLVLIGLILTRLRLVDKIKLAQTGVFIDIVAFTLLMHASGGIESGFGLVLAITVAAGALLMEGKLSLLFAALASFGVMAEHTYMQLYVADATGSFTRAGLLGATYFTVAILAHVLYRRIRDTERLAASRQVDIADLSKLNEFIIQRMEIGVLVVDERRRVRLMNKAAAQLLGVSVDTDHPSLHKIAPSLCDWIEERLALSERRTTISTDTLTVKEQEIEPSFLLLGDRPASAVLIFLRDKGALIQEAQQIKLASLGRLTASIAHNIRNPLSAVNHAGQLLAESPALQEEDQQLIRIIARNTGRIDEIVESVLQLSRRNRAESQLINLASWIEDFASEAVESQSMLAEHLIVAIAADMPEVEVEVDPRHLRQVLSNLCDNAVRHAGTPQRSANLELRTGLTTDREHAFIEVSDDGPSIDPDTAKEMFSPFFTTSVSGSGLGLYIALELCETNGIDLKYLPLGTTGNCFRLTMSAR